jgi:hypothetical protein
MWDQQCLIYFLAAFSAVKGLWQLLSPSGDPYRRGNRNRIALYGRQSIREYMHHSDIGIY